MYLRGRKAFTATAAAGLSLLLAACGSQLSPETVAAVNGAGSVGGVSQGVDGAGGLPVSDDPGLSTGGDVGSGGTSTGGAPGTGGGGTNTGGGTSSGGDTSAGGGTSTGGSATGNDKGGSCDGFKNQTGITDKTITIANASDISGPIPGLFQASQEAVKAFVAYFNATSDICGRKLELMALDSRTDAGADQQAYAKACAEAFAAVGSMSAFDSGGAATAENCGIPDIRSAAVTDERYACSTCFGAQSTKATEFQNAVPDFLMKNFPEAAQKASLIYINAGAAATNARYQRDAQAKRGMNFVYFQGIDVSEFNYAPYVQQMKERGVRHVQFLGAYQQAVRLADAMKQQGFKPDVYVLDPTGYDPRYVESGGDAVEGTRIFVNFVPFEEVNSNEELKLYMAWLQQVKPGATPSFFGLFSWSAARLFVEQSFKLGGKLSRATLIDSLRQVDNWTANGLHSPQHVGAKRTGECWRWIKLQGGRWVPDGPTKYSCAGTTTVG